MTVAEARAKCAALEVLPWDEMAVTQAITKATAAFLIASPQVTPVAGAPGMWWIGAGGFDTLGGERSLVHTLLRVARLWHPRPRVAVASSCVAARAATWAGGPTPGEQVTELATIVRRGECAAYLAPAPLALVPMEEELRTTLVALGLRTVGAFAALDAADVERRWGEAGLAAWRLARGEDRRRPVLARPEAARSAAVELAMPAATMEPVLFLVRAALERVVAQLVAEGRAAAAVSITLTLDDGRGALPAGGMPHTITREVRPARPLARVAPLFERCRVLLDGWTLTAPVCGVAVAVPATAPLTGEQGDLLAAAWRDPGAADAALERLRAELGPNVVVRPVARDEHRPERAGAWVGVGEARGDSCEVGGRPHASGADAASHTSAMASASARASAEAHTTRSAAARGGWVTGDASDGADVGANLRRPDDAGEGASDAARAATTAGTMAGTTRRPPDFNLAPDDCSPAIVRTRSASVPLARGARIGLAPPRDGARDEAPDEAPAVADRAALRLLETPESVEVECDDGVPVAMQWRGRRVAVERADGPERLSGDWWKDGYRRDYWRCEGSEGGDFVIFLDRADDGRWFLQGWYD